VSTLIDPSLLRSNIDWSLVRAHQRTFGLDFGARQERGTVTPPLPNLYLFAGRIWRSRRWGAAAAPSGLTRCHASLSKPTAPKQHPSAPRQMRNPHVARARPPSGHVVSPVSLQADVHEEETEEARRCTRMHGTRLLRPAIHPSIRLPRHEPRRCRIGSVPKVLVS
jgi:hypothetical protein